MKRRIAIRNFLLRALNQMDGEPMPQGTLFDTARTVFSPRLLDTELETALLSIQADGYAAGQRDEILGDVTWTLTPKGQHAAQRL